MFYFLIFTVGSFIGSFLNILIDRPARKETVVWGSSYCEKCRHKLAWNDLIPVWSYLFLGGRCRYCRTRIPFWLPLVEIVTGLLFVLVFWIHRAFLFNFSLTFPYFVSLFYYFALPSLLVVVFFSDLKYHLIYDQIIYFAAGITIIYHLCSQFLTTNYQPPATNYLLSAISAAAFFYFLYWLGPKVFHKDTMGLGDVKLAALIGLLLGYPHFLIALYLAFLTGALIGVILILIRKAKWQSQLAFGPFLVAATLVVWFWGEEIWKLAIRVI